MYKLYKLKGRIICKWKSIKGDDNDSKPLFCVKPNETGTVLKEHFYNRWISRTGELKGPPKTCGLTLLKLFVRLFEIESIATVPELRTSIIKLILSINSSLFKNMSDPFGKGSEACCSRSNLACKYIISISSEPKGLGWPWSHWVDYWLIFFRICPSPW